MRLMSSIFVFVFLAAIEIGASAKAADAASSDMRATMPHAQMQPPSEPPGMPAEEKMNRRFPQKVRTGDLVGLQLIDFDNRVLGTVSEVVRTPQGKVTLVVVSSGWFGFDGQTVGIPIETVGILGRQIALLDIQRAEFFGLPAWIVDGSKVIDSDETLRIALARR
jgi:sporulation protein YlmC with PRC-barrel domain